MKKSLIALAVASAVAAPAAFAATSNVDVYGIFGASVDIVDRDDTLQEDEFRVSSTASRIGFKGAEDLGGGLSAIWQVETGLDVDVGGNTWATRNTFVGLSSKTLGTARIGRYDTAYKMATGRYDVFSDTLGDYNTIMGSVNANTGVFDLRETNSISYETPEFSGFKVMGSYGQRNEAGATLVDPSLWSLAAVYANGPLSVVAAYEKHTDENFAFSTTADTSDATAWKLGAGYVFGNTRLAAIYERIKADDFFGVDLERDAWYLSLAHQMGNITLKAAYAKADETDVSGFGGVDDAADSWTLGVDYALSKRTMAYALYTALDNDTNANYRIGGNGTNGAFNPGFGNDPSGLSLGVKHSF